MTSYWKPRWPHTVFFGSFRELNYRIDIGKKHEEPFRICTCSGPGFRLEIKRSKDQKGFCLTEAPPEKAKRLWLDIPARSREVQDLLKVHFSRITVLENTIRCHSDPAKEDIFPEGPQLNWALSLVYRLWSAVPESERKYMSKAEFIE